MLQDHIKPQHHGIIVVVLIVLAAFLTILCVSTFVDVQNKIKEGRYIGQEIESKNIINVSDSAEVYAAPDLALMSFSVRTEKATVAQATTENTSKMNAVIEAIKNAGVETKDIKTTNYNIYPRYDYPDGRQVLKGYEVYQSVQAKIRDLTKISNIISVATSAGANQVGDLQFTIDDEDEYKQQARTEATAKARAKAESIADALGVKLVRVVGFSESGSSPMPMYDYRSEGYGIGGGGEAPQIETGENKIQISVNITYEIN